MEKNYDHLLKLLLIGDSGVGKTCLFQRFSEDVFASYLCATIGVDFMARTIEIDGKKIKLQIWDTAGAERFKSLMSAYFRGAHGIVLMYDVTSEWSFNHTSDWIQMIEEHATADVVKIVLGHKCDMNDRREVSREEGEKLATNYGIKFLETSAKSGINVEEAVFIMIRDILSQMDRKTQGSQASRKTRKNWKIIDQFFNLGKHVENEEK